MNCLARDLPWHQHLARCADQIRGRGEQDVVADGAGAAVVEEPDLVFGGGGVGLGPERDVEVVVEGPVGSEVDDDMRELQAEPTA